MSYGIEVNVQLNGKSGGSLPGPWYRPVQTPYRVRAYRSCCNPEGETIVTAGVIILQGRMYSTGEEERRAELNYGDLNNMWGCGEVDFYAWSWGTTGRVKEMEAGGGGPYKYGMFIIQDLGIMAKPGEVGEGLGVVWGITWFRSAPFRAEKRISLSWSGM